MSWWKNVWRRQSQEAELDAELRFHAERRVQDYIDAGLSLDDARRRVRFEFGGLDQTKEACRDVRPLRWLDELVRDVRLGFREPRPRAVLRRVGDAHPGAGHRHERDDVQRAQRGRAPAAAVRASGRAGEAQHAPHRPEPARRHVGGQLSRLAAAEPPVRGDDVLPADERQRRHVCRHRRATARAGGPGRPRVLHAARHSAAHRKDLFARGIRPQGAGRGAERRALAGAVRTIPRGTRSDAPHRWPGPRGHRRHAANISPSDERHAILEAALDPVRLARDEIESATAMASK